VPQSAAVSLGPSPQHHQPKIAREWGRGGEFAMVAEWWGGVTWAVRVGELSALHRVLSHQGTVPKHQGTHSPPIQAP